MEAIMMPVVVLGITGILMGLFLAYASKKFEVEVDPKVEAILAVLPVQTVELVDSQVVLDMHQE